MIVYLDTSAVVPILIEEPGSSICRRLWQDADQSVSTRLTYVEVAAALAMAERGQRLTASAHRDAWSNFVGLWPDVNVVSVSTAVIESAAALAKQMSLRGYDAVHCATAIAVADPELVAASGDRMLLMAWQENGITVVNTAA